MMYVFHPTPFPRVPSGRREEGREGGVRKWGEAGGGEGWYECWFDDADMN